jgi:hypothetical protein
MVMECRPQQEMLEPWRNNTYRGISRVLHTVTKVIKMKLSSGNCSSVNEKAPCWCRNHLPLAHASILHTSMNKGQNAWIKCSSTNRGLFIPRSAIFERRGFIFYILCFYAR